MGTVTKNVWCDHCKRTVTLNSDDTCPRCGDKQHKRCEDGDGCCGCIFIICAIVGFVTIMKWIF